MNNRLAPSAAISLVLALPFLAGAQSPRTHTLPVEVQADLILKEVDASLAAKRETEALDKITNYRELGIGMPADLLFHEANLSAEVRDYPRSLAALSEYFSLPDVREDANYAAALTLHVDVSKREAAVLSRRSAAGVRQAKAQCNTAETGSQSTLTPGTIFRDCPFTPEMVPLPGGSFTMGNPDTTARRSEFERPVHGVTITPLAVGRFEVTFEEWDACVEGGGCNGYRPADRWGRGRQPVINVSWDDAQAYVDWLSTVTGARYRLLSEAEWEYAARGGATTPYATGATITRAQANIQNPDGAVPVGSYAANAFGLHDMHGNLWEWTQDCWNEDYADAPANGGARVLGACGNRVFRGGCFYNEPDAVRVTFRYAPPRDRRLTIAGIRVAREL